jgi:hypothetical protein
VKITIEKDAWGTEFIIFSVPIPGQSPIYMSIKVTEYNNNSSGIVIVDAQKFLQVWKNEPYSIHGELSNGNPQTWPKDRKYPAAEKGFSFGYKNPVPLAYVSYGKSVRKTFSYKFLWFGKSEYQEQFDYIGFTNGITRTIWLLTQGCTSFPVECEMPGARELHQVAGASETEFYTIGELVKSLSNS